MQILTILYQYIKTLIKHVFLLNFTYELLMSFRSSYNTFRMNNILIFHSSYIAGASSDFAQATNIARAMVTKYAMSDKVN